MKFKIISPKYGTKIVLIDDEDWGKIKNYIWRVNLNKSSEKFYVRTHFKKNFGKRPSMSLHRFIMGIPQGKQVDHINGDTLDNRRKNLRVCNGTENNRNSGKQKNNTSGYKGVCWNKNSKKWQAFIGVDRKLKHLGCFETPEEAAFIYNCSAIIHHGNFALLNDIPNKKMIKE